MKYFEMRNRFVYRGFIILLMVVLLAVASAAYGESKLDEPVPFGITCSEDGQYIPVFDEIGSKNRIDLLLPGQLCALDFSELELAYYWHHIIYFDDEGEPHAGYVKENNFEQLTVSGLAEAMRDPDSADLIDQYIELAKDSPLFLGEESFTRVGLTETTGQHYVLNTNTMKFHFPDCKSVKQIKDKNRKDYTGDRQYLIDVGYVPCKNCNP